MINELAKKDRERDFVLTRRNNAVDFLKEATETCLFLTKRTQRERVIGTFDKEYGGRKK